MNDQDPRRPVSLEDLLRVKRAERPQQEFWSGWQHDLRLKTKSESSMRRPWWKDALPLLSISLARLHLPVGVVAVAALAFFVARESEPATTLIPASSSGASVTRTVSVSQDFNRANKAILSELRETGITPMVRSSFSAPGEISRAVAMLANSHEWERSPAARTIEANLALVRENDVFAANSLQPRSVFAKNLRSQVQTTRSPVTSQNARREWLAYAYVGNQSSLQPTSFQGAETSQSRINEDQLIENVTRRIGARGDRLLLRF